MSGGRDIAPALRDMILRAAEARRRGDRAGELTALDAALALDPDHPQPLNARGMRALADQDYTLAADMFRRAVAADPREPALLINLATACRNLGDDQGEAAALDAVLSLDRTHFMALLRKAELLERTDRPIPAAEIWNGIFVLAEAIDPMPPALAARIEEARSFVATQLADFSATIDRGLARARSGLSRQALRRFDACVEAATGRRRIFVNECSGLHFPFLPADEFFDRNLFPWFPELEAKTPQIRAELQALLQTSSDAIRPYVRQEEGTPVNKWTPLDRSMDWGACFLWEHGRRNEPICKLCPETAAILDALPLADIPGRGPSAFFSLLRPHSHIPPHTGVTNSRAIVHLPLIVPDGCWFRVGAERRPWEEGEAFAFDDTIEHEAMNESGELRAVLIMDAWNPHLTNDERALLRQFFMLSDELAQPHEMGNAMN